MGGAAVLVVKVVGMFPDVEGQEGLEAFGDRVAGIGFLSYHQSTVGVGGEPDPAATEEGGAFGLKLGLEGVEGAPLLYNLGLEMPGRAGHDGTICRFELREIQVMIKYLACVVEDRASRGSADNVLKCKTFELSTRQ